SPVSAIDPNELQLIGFVRLSAEFRVNNFDMTASAKRRKSIAHHRILSLLGEGGMGSVYKAHDEKLDRIVALKLLGAAALPNEDRRPRFLQEARAASALNHPHILTIYDIGEADGKPFIAMEYIQG